MDSSPWGRIELDRTERQKHTIQPHLCALFGGIWVSWALPFLLLYNSFLLSFIELVLCVYIYLLVNLWDKCFSLFCVCLGMCVCVVCMKVLLITVLKYDLCHKGLWGNPSWEGVNWKGWSLSALASEEIMVHLTGGQNLGQVGKEMLVSLGQCLSKYSLWSNHIRITWGWRSGGGTC